MAGSGGASSRGLIGRALLALLFGAGAVASCGPNRDPGECGGQPAFILMVSAEPEALPDDLEIQVRYGGSPVPETFRLMKPHRREVVFCSGFDGSGRPVAPHSDGAAGEAGAAESVTCRLWTEGPASVAIRAQGYPPVLLDLQVDHEQCTVTESVELARGDGGSGS